MSDCLYSMTKEYLKRYVSESQRFSRIFYLDQTTNSQLECHNYQPTNSEGVTSVTNKPHGADCYLRN